MFSLPAVATQLAMLVTVGLAAIYDARYRRIPNWVVLLGLMLGFGLNSFLFEWQGFNLAFKGMALGLLIYFPLYLLRAMGAGDAKLMAAVGSMVGPADWMGVFFVTAILGGVAAMILLIVKKQVARGVGNVGYLVRKLLSFQAPYLTNEQLDVTSDKALRMPHGVIIAAACVVFLAAGWFWAPKP